MLAYIEIRSLRQGCSQRDQRNLGFEMVNVYDSFGLCGRRGKNTHFFLEGHLKIFQLRRQLLKSTRSFRDSSLRQL